mgnify:CR=1 FL=1
MRNVCGECARYRQMPNCENICDKTGKVVPFLAQRECFETKEIEMEEKRTKVCKICGKELPIEMFRKNIKSKDGYTDTCIECINVNIRAGFNKKKDVQVKPNSAAPIRSEDTTPMVDDIPHLPDQAPLNALRQRGYDVTCTKTIAL